jgi:hypothetical protein
MSSRIAAWSIRRACSSEQRSRTRTTASSTGSPAATRRWKLSSISPS